MRGVFLFGLCVCACSVGADSLAVYHVGNSISDQLDAIPSIAESKGDQVELGRKTIPGAGIGYHYTHGGIPSDMSSGTWDIVLTLAFGNGNELGVSNDARYIGCYYDAGLATNPDCRLVVFTQWPGTGDTDDGDYATAWNRTLDTTAAGYAQPYGSAAYHETLTLALRAKYPGKQVDLFPIGHVLYEFDQRAKAGSIPGYSSAYGLYRDGIHLNKEGIYLQNLTAYAVYFKQNPENAALTFSLWWGDETVSQAFADLAAALAWEVVTAMSDWTGVEAANEICTPAPGAARPSFSVSSPRHISLNGRSMVGMAPGMTRAAGVSVDMRSKQPAVKLPLRNE